MASTKIVGEPQITGGSPEVLMVIAQDAPYMGGMPEYRLRWDAVQGRWEDTLAGDVQAVMPMALTGDPEPEGLLRVSLIVQYAGQDPMIRTLTRKAVATTDDPAEWDWRMPVRWNVVASEIYQADYGEMLAATQAASEAATSASAAATAASTAATAATTAAGAANAAAATADTAALNATNGASAATTAAGAANAAAVNASNAASAANTATSNANTATGAANAAATAANTASGTANALIGTMTTIRNAVGEIGNNTLNLAWAVVDEGMTAGLGVLSDGTLYPPKLGNLPESSRSGSNYTLDAYLFHSGFQDMGPNNLGLLYGILDDAGRVAFGVKDDGSIYAPSLVIEEPTAPNNLVVYLGDSITRGKYGVVAGGDTETEADKWTYKLATARGWTYSNKGIDGSCVASGFLYSMYDRHTADVIAQNPGRVTIWGGTNDWANNVPIGSIGTLTATTFAGAYRMMAESILSSTSALLYFITPLVRDPAAGPSEFAANRAEQSPNTAGFTLDEYRQVVRDVARLMARLYPGRAFLIDAGRELEAPFRYRRSTLMDVTQFHPNPTGMELLYRHFDTYIK